MIILPTLTLSVSPSTVTTLSCDFNYKKYIPKKRQVTRMTSKGSFTQKSLPLFLPGMDTIDWSIELTTGVRAQELYDLYLANENYIFNGAYGEELLVDFVDFGSEELAGYFKLVGKFRVICVESQVNFGFKCV